MLSRAAQSCAASPHMARAPKPGSKVDTSAFVLPVAIARRLRPFPTADLLGKRLLNRRSDRLRFRRWLGLRAPHRVGGFSVIRRQPQVLLHSQWRALLSTKSGHGLELVFPSPPLEVIGFDLDVILVFGAFPGHKARNLAHRGDVEDFVRTG